MVAHDLSGYQKQFFMQTPDAPTGISRIPRFQRPRFMRCVVGVILRIPSGTWNIKFGSFHRLTPCMGKCQASSR